MYRHTDIQTEQCRKGKKEFDRERERRREREREINRFAKLHSDLSDLQYDSMVQNAKTN
jgi:hypothetical protein